MEEDGRLAADGGGGDRGKGTYFRRDLGGRINRVWCFSAGREPRERVLEGDAQVSAFASEQQGERQ